MATEDDVDPYRPKGQDAFGHMIKDGDKPAYTPPSKVSTADLGAAAAKAKAKPAAGESGPPKQNEGESVADYAERVRKWRGSADTSPQKAAIVRKLKEPQ